MATEIVGEVDDKEVQEEEVEEHFLGLVSRMDEPGLKHWRMNTD